MQHHVEKTIKSMCLPHLSGREKVEGQGGSAYGETSTLHEPVSERKENVIIHMETI